MIAGCGILIKAMLFKDPILLTKRQLEELAKLFLDVGKLTLGSLVLGLFQLRLEPVLLLTVGVLGLTISIGMFILGLGLFKEVK